MGRKRQMASACLIFFAFTIIELTSQSVMSLELSSCCMFLAAPALPSCFSFLARFWVVPRRSARGENDKKLPQVEITCPVVQEVTEFEDFTGRTDAVRTVTVPLASRAISTSSTSKKGPKFPVARTWGRHTSSCKVLGRGGAPLPVSVGFATGDGRRCHCRPAKSNEFVLNRTVLFAEI